MEIIEKICLILLIGAGFVFIGLASLSRYPNNNLILQYAFGKEVDKKKLKKQLWIVFGIAGTGILGIVWIIFF